MSDSKLECLLACTPDDKHSDIKQLYDEKGYVEAVTYLWDEILPLEAKLEAEHVVGDHDAENKYYKLFVQDFNLKEHFSQVCSHRKFIKKAYERFKKYLNHMRAEDAEKHDLTKFMMAQAVGYTARWVHNVDNKSWQAALNHHYCNEPHHPQYWGEGKQMEMRFLEESLVDMAASRWERQLKGDENALNHVIVDFNPVFLKRYHDVDRKIVQELIAKIQCDDPNLPSKLKSLLECTPVESQADVQKLYNDKGYVEAVTYLWDEILPLEAKLEAEHAVGADDAENKFYKLFVQDFNLREHFSQVCSHRKFIKKAYERFKKYLSHMRAEDAEKHDLTKFMMAQAVGYTARWVHNVDNKSWQAALNHHYCNEPHHPQYWGDGNRMEMRFLEESLVDMAASRWERQLKGAENALNHVIVDFNPVFLKRYHEEDRKLVEAMIEKIQSDDPNRPAK